MICSELRAPAREQNGDALELVALAGPHPGCHLICSDLLVLLRVSQAPAEMSLEKDPESRPLWKCSAMPTKHAKVGGVSAFQS